MQFRRRIRGRKERGRRNSGPGQGFHATTDVKQGVPSRILGAWGGLDADDVVGRVLKVDVVVVTDWRLGPDGRGGIRACVDSQPSVQGRREDDRVSNGIDQYIPLIHVPG